MFRFQSENKNAFPEKIKIEEKLNLSLTKREYELFQLLYQGKSYREIAETNFISINTVKHHLKRLFQKLQINSRHEAVSLVMEKVKGS